MDPDLTIVPWKIVVLQSVVLAVHVNQQGTAGEYLIKLMFNIIVFYSFLLLLAMHLLLVAWHLLLLASKCCTPGLQSLPPSHPSIDRQIPRCQ